MEETFDVFLIDCEGKKYSSKTISSHIGLAMKRVDEDEELKKEFKESGKKSELEFLLGNKGDIAGSEISNYYKKITFDSKLASEIQKKIIKYYRDRGWNLEDLAIEKEKMERGEI